MSTEELFLTMHWRGWTFETNGHGAMFFWKNDYPIEYLVLMHDAEILLHADLTDEIVDVLKLMRSWQVREFSERLGAA